MIITQKKPIEEIMAMVADAKTVAIEAVTAVLPPARPAASRRSMS